MTGHFHFVRRHPDRTDKDTPLIGCPVVRCPTRLVLRALRRFKEEKNKTAFLSEQAMATINALRTPSVGGDASSILNRIVSEWEAAKTRERES